MTTLKDALSKVDRDQVVRDAVELIDAEVQRKGGLSGAALKVGYGVVKKLKGGTMIEDAVNHLLDEFTGALSPLYDSYLAQEAVKRFEAYLPAQGKQGADALLAITDRKAAKSDNKILKSTYDKLRDQAEKHVIEALPGVGRLIDKHLPR
jgi:hypothetical protein